MRCSTEKKTTDSMWDAFGSLDKMRTASVEELAGVEGMNLPAAEAVYLFFQNTGGLQE